MWVKAQDSDRSVPNIERTAPGVHLIAPLEAAGREQKGSILKVFLLVQKSHANSSEAKLWLVTSLANLKVSPAESSARFTAELSNNENAERHRALKSLLSIFIEHYPDKVRVTTRIVQLDAFTFKAQHENSTCTAVCGYTARNLHTG